MIGKVSVAAQVVWFLALPSVSLPEYSLHGWPFLQG